jgi:membrane protein implicated in regulation of membrane protease activity
MTFRTLMLYIGFAILGFYLIGFVLNLAAWALDVALIIGLILVVTALLNKFYESKKRPKKHE